VITFARVRRICPHHSEILLLFILRSGRTKANTKRFILSIGISLRPKLPSFICTETLVHLATCADYLSIHIIGDEATNLHPHLALVIMDQRDAFEMHLV
jgi:hypothetical protein